MIWDSHHRCRRWIIRLCARLYCATGLVLLGCQPAHKTSVLEGEWIVDLRREGADPGSGKDLDGFVVLDSQLPCYCDEEVQRTLGAIGGRACFDYHVLGRPMNSATSQYFLLGAGADMAEEIEATVDGAQRVRIWGVGSPVTFEGVLQGESIDGRWLFISRGDTLGSGTFVMRRQLATEYSDSARTRAGREVHVWKTASDTLQEPADTAAPIH